MNVHSATPIDPPREALGVSPEVERLALALRQVVHTVRSAEFSQNPNNDSHKNPEEAPEKSATRESAQKLVGDAAKYFQEQQGVNLHFKLLEDSNDVQVEMVDADSRKVIRKIPQDEVVKLNDAIKRMAKGVLDKSV